MEEEQTLFRLVKQLKMATLGWNEALFQLKGGKRRTRFFVYGQKRDN